MAKYILLLRGVNVGGKHKVSMAECKARLAGLGFTGIQSYLNSGNLLFDTADAPERIADRLRTLFAEHYDFPLPFVLIPAADYLQEAQMLPAWWNTELARRDVLFFTDEVDRPAMLSSLQSMPLRNEILHIGKLAVFWGKYDEAEFLKTAYHRLLLRQPYYRQISIRNGNTFDRLAELCRTEEERKAGSARKKGDKG